MGNLNHSGWFAKSRVTRDASRYFFNRRQINKPIYGNDHLIEGIQDLKEFFKSDEKKKSSRVTRHAGGSPLPT
jgi:hypothetical protein